ncbi:SDR family oxidoreductase [Capnocytophaga ochracea]|uniref:SDR family oxidoreductase n=1 Tax=Capnocytophaga ochracea TaxID=1018 RepID=UPI00223270AA|nr:SDR family oxidoreductase [Capnocytophaga ochracea]UZD39464.1 SDR family oxidoreductase [Capnocytophaga ochracea]
MKENIKDKVVIITGASSGLGEASALYLAQYGAIVVAVARRKDRLESLVKRIGSQGGKALAIVCDVTKREDLERVAQETLKAYGRIDVLVNNAGLMAQAPLEKLKVDEWDKMIDINIKGVLYGIAAVLPTMQKQHSGHIINLSSVAGLKVAAGRGTVYSGTKFAVKAISEGLRMETAKDNIRVTTLYPGAVESELKYGSSDPEASAGIQAFYKEYEIPADSVARAIAYAIEQPEDVAINEITLRPTKQEF